MKSRCRQSLLFVAFLLLSLTSVNAAEAELKAQHQLDQNTWVATYEVVSWNSSTNNYIDSDNLNQRTPAQLETLVSFLEDIQGVSRVSFDKATGLITVVSNQQVEFPSNLNK